MNKYLDLLTVHTNKITVDKQLTDEIINQTAGYSIEFVHIKQRIWHLAHGLQIVPLCPVCVVDQIKWDKQNNRYSLTCGRKCATKQMANNPAVRKKTESTNLATYGTKAPAQNVDIVQKQIKTKTAKYGSHHGHVWKIKVQQGLQTSLGVVNPSQLQWVNDKKRQAWADKTDQEIDEITQRRIGVWAGTLGTDNPQRNQHIKDKTATTNAEKYGGRAPMCDQEVRERAQLTNIERYGVKSFSQRHISPESLLMLDDIDWLTQQHHTNQKTLGQIASELGVDLTTVSLRCDQHNIEKKMFHKSAAEDELSQLLTAHNVDHRTNVRDVIAPLELDIYLPSHNLAIEYCGLYWHSDRHTRITASYHKNKLDVCTKSGIRLLTIFEDEWITNKQLVCDKILSILRKSQSPTVYARKCDIVGVSNNDKRAFFDANHIQGSGPGSITYGLTHNNQLVACMTFVHLGNNTYTLNRYATNCSVPGGFSKLLSHFKKHNCWSQIISFADLRWSSGEVYSKNGFELDKILPPDYYWVVGGERQHKFAWRHNNRLKHLPLYDRGSSEAVNMKLHGYHKIYNCGLQRWVLTNQPQTNPLT